MASSKGRIFISYSRRDLEIVQPLADELAQRTGDHPWMDLSGIETGSQFEDDIMRAIDACEVVLFAMTENSMSSEWTRRELNYARGVHKKIYPVNMTGSELKGWFLFSFSEIDCIDYRDQAQRNKLYADIAKIVSPKMPILAGVVIPPSQVFASARNLGVSLMSALTGVPTDKVKINQSMMSIGLGCFGLVGLNCSDYNEESDLEWIDENTDWGLCSTIRYELLKDHLSLKKPYARFWMLNLNINTEGLVKGRGEDDIPIQFFAPARLVWKLRTGDQRVVEFPPSGLDVSNYVECGGMEPNDAVLLPSQAELDVFYDEKDGEQRFALLVDIIQRFASNISVKLLYAGNVNLSIMHYPDNQMDADIRWFDGGLDPEWKPTKEQVERVIEELKMKPEDISDSARKILIAKA